MPESGQPSEDLTLDGLDEKVRTIVEAFQPVLDFSAFDTVRRAAFDDQECWTREFGRSHDPSALGVERNVFRYRPAEVVLRLAEDGDLADLARLLCAGVRARARLLISTARCTRMSYRSAATASAYRKSYCIRGSFGANR